MTDQLVAEPELRVVVGTTTLSAKALQHIATGIARDAARVPVDDVSVALADERGRLRVSVTVPLALTPGRDVSVRKDGEELRRRLIEGMRDLSGRAVDAVDIRYAGVRTVTERRVR